MNDSSKSYRRILGSTSLMAGSSVINILIGIVRTKIVAVLLGPAGIGLIGIFQSLVSTAATFVGLGLSTAATRQIAESNGKEDSGALIATRQALFLGTVLLAACGGLTVWLLRDVLATNIVSDESQSTAVGWLAIAVALSVVSASQTAVIQGMRQLIDLAKLGVLSGLIGTVLGVVIIWQFGYDSLAAYVIAGPAVSVLLGFYYVKPRGALSIRVAAPEVVSNLSGMAKLGMALFVYATLEQVTFLLIRTDIGRTLGTVELGYYQAGWTVAVMYLGIITGAMSSDYLPRIAEMAGNHDGINRLINQQTAIGLLLITPIVILMIGYAPFIIKVMYSDDFVGSVGMLKILLMADIIKMISWPIGFAILGMGDAAVFSRQGPFILAVLLAVIYVTLPYCGLLAVGIGLMVSQSSGLIAAYRHVNTKTGFRFEAKVKKLGIISFAFAAITYLICFYSENVGAFIATVLALVMALSSYKDIKHKLTGQV